MKCSNVRPDPIISGDGVIAIPKAGTPGHVEQNLRALDIILSAGDLAVLDRVFPPPAGKRALEMI